MMNKYRNKTWLASTNSTKTTYVCFSWEIKWIVCMNSLLQTNIRPFVTRIVSLKYFAQSDNQTHRNKLRDIGANATKMKQNRRIRMDINTVVFSNLKCVSALYQNEPFRHSTRTLHLSVRVIVKLFQHITSQHVWGFLSHQKSRGKRENSKILLNFRFSTENSNGPTDSHLCVTLQQTYIFAKTYSKICLKCK